jgi:hypothetical protein
MTVVSYRHPAPSIHLKGGKEPTEFIVGEGGDADNNITINLWNKRRE